MNQQLLNLPKTILENALEKNGHMLGCPIEYTKDSNKWTFRDEKQNLYGEQYNSFEEVLTALSAYCEKYVEQENQKRNTGETL